MKYFEAEVLDVVFDIQYTYDPGFEGDYFEAPEGDRVYIEKIVQGNSDVDLTDVLAQYVINEIETKIYDYERMA